MCGGAGKRAGFRWAILISGSTENATSYPAPGQLLIHPGGISETEILLAYGSVRFASKVGQLAGNHFLTIIEGREHLPKLGQLTLWQGAQPIEFSTLLDPDPNRSAT